MNDAQLLRYSRHILLNEIGIEGQEKLLNAKVLVVGCGGLACAALPYLVSAGVGQIVVADDDVVDESNLQRQIAFCESDVGDFKVAAMARYLQRLNQTCCVQTLAKRLDETDLDALLPTCQVVLDCTDHFASRQRINRAAFRAKKALVSAAAIRFDGQLSVYRFDGERDKEACLSCLFSGDEFNDGACAVFGVFAPLVGIMGASQASEALKILLGQKSETGVLRCYNALSAQWQHFSFQKNPACSVCGKMHDVQAA